MGLTTSLFTSLSGLNTNSQAINVTGNNIANVNTTAFKASRVMFETQISETLSQGTAPTAELGGTNQTQIGLGTRIGAVMRNFNDGSVQTTGVNTDLAIEGDGFYVLDFAGTQRYTRVGAFNLNSNFNLVNPDGGLLQGFGVDDQFNVVEGVLGDVSIPLGALTVAEATRTVRFRGNLNSAGDMPSTVSTITSNPLTDAATGGPASPTSLLTDLQDASGNSLFATGYILTLSDATKGSAVLPDQRFEVGVSTTQADTAGTTLESLVSFLDDALGIDSTADASAGIAIDSSGQIVFTPNKGRVNDLVISNGNIVVNDGSTTRSAFTLTKSAGPSQPDQSVRTTFDIFDSLGTPLTIDLSLVPEEKSDAGTAWRYYIQSADDTDLDRVLGSGLLNFDNNGRLITDANPTFVINREGTGAISPQQVELEFKSGDGSVSALSNQDSDLSKVTSELTAFDRDGSSIGTLDDFSVGDDGTIIGNFSNGLQRNLGRVVMATFVNPQGLIENGSNLFSSSATSGTASIVKPTSGGAGRTINGALELSNVDLSQEFINLILYSTGFSANSRVLTTSDRLIQELLATVR